MSMGGDHLSIRELKGALIALGVDISGIVERPDLEQLFREKAATMPMRDIWQQVRCYNGRSSEEPAQNRARKDEDHFAKLADELVEIIFSYLDLAALHSMALVCQRYRARATHLLSTKTFYDREKLEDEDEEEDEAPQIMMSKSLFDAFAQSVDTLYATKVQLGAANNNITVRMKCLGNGIIQIYVGLYCDCSGDIEVQATVRPRVNPKTLSITLRGISDEIDRATGELSFVAPGQMVRSERIPAGTRMGDLIWTSELSRDSEDGDVLLRVRASPFLSTPLSFSDGNYFNWLPPCGAWVRASSDHRENFIAEDLETILRDEELEREIHELGRSRAGPWVRDVRGVPGLECLEQAQIMAQFHSRAALRSTVLNVDGELLSRRRCLGRWVQG
jgi:hypothetical protein